MTPAQGPTQPGVVDDVADCEVADEWFLAQDANAWSSLAYAAVGGVLAVAVVRRRLPWCYLVLAAVLVLEGAGSALFHGEGGDVAQVLHDAPLLALVGFAAGWHVGRLARRTAELGAWIGVTAGALAGLAAGLSSSAVVTNTAVAGGVAVVAVAEWGARRRGRPAVWGGGLLALLGLAALAWALGTTDSPLCAADSWAQPHAAWHTLSAGVVLWWTDRALAAERPAQAPRLGRRAVDRMVGLLAIGLTHAFHRSLDVLGRDRLPAHRPVLVVANHGNGFVDPIIVAGVLRRLPRFIAKAALWKVPVARPFLGFAGVLPVYRTSDGDRAASNRSVFEACHQELARGATVAIFPEGTTGDRAGLDRVRSGASRIALGAVADAPDVAVVPVGLAFESRVVTRSRAVAMIGAPIEVAPFAGHGPDAAGEPDRADVAALTEAIRAALEDVSPEFESVEDREVLRAAARTTRAVDGAGGGREASFGDVEVLARRLAAAPAPARARVLDAYRTYATQLQLIGVTDEQLAPARTSPWRVVASVAAVVVLGSLVTTATLLHLPALVAVAVATGMVRSTATKGTVRMLVGLTTGLLTWIVAGIVLGDGLGAVVAAVLVAVGGMVALAVWTPLTRAAATIWGRLRVRDRSGLLPPVLDARAALVARVHEAAAPP